MGARRMRCCGAVAVGCAGVRFWAVPDLEYTRGRAAALMAAGAVDAATIVARALGVTGAPASIAEHLVATLLGGDPRFVRNADGTWRRVTTTTTTTPTDSPRLSEMTFAVVDVETTGGRPHAGHRVTEFAAAVVRGGVVAEVYETLVNPERSIPPFVSALTHITWDMVRDKPTFAEVRGDVARVLEGHVFVAHNVAFDWKFVSAELTRTGGAPLAGRRLCTVKLARRLLPHLASRSLDGVAYHYGVSIAARHRAAGDAVATAECLVRMMGDAADRGCERWADLEVLLNTRPPAKRRRTAMPTQVIRENTA
jgi:DNA polymerase III subunit epsilon